MHTTVAATAATTAGDVTARGEVCMIAVMFALLDVIFAYGVELKYIPFKYSAVSL